MALLSAFNPHEYTPAQLNALATARETELARALDTIRSNLSAETMQHLIISAPRGYGKSFLMRHIQVEAQRIAEAEKLPLAIVLMPEEMPHVKEPETLIQEITRALTGGGGETAQLRWHEDDGEAWDAAVSSLQGAITDKLGKDGLLVALVENFDQLLRRAFRQDVHAQRLRNLITLPGGRLMLIAASASGSIDRDYDKALFQAFDEITLEPWSVDDCMRFFDRQREAAGKRPLDEAAHARAKAVANFIGGTPRLATLLGEQLFDEDLLNAADLLRGLVDELTPYYKSRIEVLPGRSQLLFDALLRGGEPATQSDLAQRVQANSQAAIAAPFGDLVKERAVIGVKAPGSAEILYRVADRVFAHYYRRRIIDHGRELCPLEGLVDLLADFYNPEEKRAKALEYLRLGLVSEARVLARLHDIDLGNPKANRRRSIERLANEDIPERLIPYASDDGKEVLKQIADAVNKRDIDSAYDVSERALNKSISYQDKAIILIARSVLDSYEGLEYGVDASESAISAAEISGNKKIVWIARRAKAEKLFDADREAESLLIQRKALEEARASGFDVDVAETLIDIAISLIFLNKNEEAVDCLAEIREIAKKNKLDYLEIKTWLLISVVSARMKDFIQSVEYYARIVIITKVMNDQFKINNLSVVGSDLASEIVKISLDSEQEIDLIGDFLRTSLIYFEDTKDEKLRPVDSLLIGFTVSAIEKITHDKHLSIWADLVEVYFPNRLQLEISRMRMAADYHRSGRRAEVLARTEPDFASTLKLMFPPAAAPLDASPKAKRGGGRRRKISP
jgi:hypothetical protein